MITTNIDVGDCDDVFFWLVYHKSLYVYRTDIFWCFCKCQVLCLGMYFILFHCFTFYAVSYISKSEFFHLSKSSSFFSVSFSIDVVERRTLLYLFLRVSTSSLRAALSIWGKDKRRKDMTSFGIHGHGYIQLFLAILGVLEVAPGTC